MKTLLGDSCITTAVKRKHIKQLHLPTIRNTKTGDASGRISVRYSSLEKLDPKRREQPCNVQRCRLVCGKPFPARLHVGASIIEIPMFDRVLICA